MVQIKGATDQNPADLTLGETGLFSQFPDRLAEVRTDPAGPGLTRTVDLGLGPACHPGQPRAANLSAPFGVVGAAVTALTFGHKKHIPEHSSSHNVN